MKIIKILNNNVALVNDENKELVVMGKGIAFQKKIGDLIENDKIEKKFMEKTDDFYERFSEVMTIIQPIHLEIVSEIVEYASDYLNTKLNDNIYITLVDHINFALTRFNSDFQVKNALLWETKKFYPREYEIGLKALKIIEEKTEAKMSDDEAGFIAIHIVNAEQDSTLNITQEALKMIQNILTIINYHFGIKMDEESMNYARLITHLQFFSRRVLSKEKIESEPDSLYDQVKVRYPNSNECAIKIAAFLENKYQINIKDDELVYLIIHIHRTTKNRR